MPLDVEPIYCPEQIVIPQELVSVHGCAEGVWCLRGDLYQQTQLRAPGGRGALWVSSPCQSDVLI